MSKLMTIVALLVGLSACHAGFASGDKGQRSNYVATNAWELAVAQALDRRYGHRCFDDRIT